MAGLAFFGFRASFGLRISGFGFRDPALAFVTHRFHKHYTLEEARGLLPQIRQWLKRIVQFRQELGKLEKRLSALSAMGCDLGGSVVNGWVRAIAEVQDVLMEFHRREIQLKDLDRGLIDFPSILGDKEVFLCWEEDEEDIEFWHDLDAGYSGRERLSGLE